MNWWKGLLRTWVVVSMAWLALWAYVGTSAYFDQRHLLDNPPKASSIMDEVRELSNATERREQIRSEIVDATTAGLSVPLVLLGLLYAGRWIATGFRGKD